MAIRFPKIFRIAQRQHGVEIQRDVHIIYACKSSWNGDFSVWNFVLPSIRNSCSSLESLTCMVHLFPCEIVISFEELIATFLYSPRPRKIFCIIQKSLF